MAQQNSTRECNKRVQELVPSRPVQPNETIVIDDDDDIEDSGPPNVNPVNSERAKQTDKPDLEVINLDDKNNVRILMFHGRQSCSLSSQHNYT